MCLIYCPFCRDAGTVRSWAGQSDCVCVQPCPSCGNEATTARHRSSCERVKQAFGVD